MLTFQHNLANPTEYERLLLHVDDATNEQFLVKVTSCCGRAVHTFACMERKQMSQNW